MLTQIVHGHELRLDDGQQWRTTCLILSTSVLAERMLKPIHRGMVHLRWLIQYRSDPGVHVGIRPELPDWANGVMEREEVYQVLPANLNAIEEVIEAHTRAERVPVFEPVPG